MNYDEIKKDFYKAVDNPAGWQHIGHFFKKIKTENPSVVLDALLSIFINKSEINSLYRVQEVAGGCLWKLKPRYKRQINEDIRAILNNWDVSVEELPWYFADAMGVEALKNEVESILGEEISEYEKRKANTILYWISRKDTDDFKKKLNQKWKKFEDNNGIKSDGKKPPRLMPDVLI